MLQTSIILIACIAKSEFDQFMQTLYIILLPNIAQRFFCTGIAYHHKIGNFDQVEHYDGLAKWVLWALNVSWAMKSWLKIKSHSHIRTHSSGYVMRWNMYCAALSKMEPQMMLVAFQADIPTSVSWCGKNIFVVHKHLRANLWNESNANEWPVGRSAVKITHAHRPYMCTLFVRTIRRSYLDPNM